ncbi:MAG TPA: hypothetical protein GX012_03045 [Acholeplasma sp.]|nr:hypothetical protein [Acholeplasma sp.]
MTIYPSLIENVLNINEKINFNHKIKDRNDIIKIEDSNIIGVAKWQDKNLLIDLNIDVELTLASTRTLKPIKHHLKFPLNLIFGDHKEADFVLTNEIDLDEIIFGHIILEKPLSIYTEDEELLVENKKTVHPAFEKLKDLKL